MSTVTSKELDERTTGGEVVYGAEECYRQCIELVEGLGFPKGVHPLKNLTECGRVKETGFVWMKQKKPYEHFFKEINTRVSYGVEVTAYVEKGKMKRMSGVKSKQLMLWIPIVEMSLEEGGDEIFFKSSLGIGKSFPVTAYMTEEEKEKYFEKKKKKEMITNA